MDWGDDVCNRPLLCGGIGREPSPLGATWRDAAEDLTRDRISLPRSATAAIRFRSPVHHRLDSSLLASTDASLRHACMQLNTHQGANKETSKTESVRI
ncbi:hypothetical protein D9619_008533 [Psilocybe cf. subviscida]|uniref:Uncharacterized protein n=1 Tax=Psilocybe cf. subviscida TaxID=2480587 RepID=A0A8H5B9I2_9AGAR|nr:hypothetical protein D9619_008533 [Psilocybe cf. subviscida]